MFYPGYRHLSSGPLNELFANLKGVYIDNNENIAFSPELRLSLCRIVEGSFVDPSFFHPSVAGCLVGSSTACPLLCFSALCDLSGQILFSLHPLA